jgi:hypothetical protein
VLEPLVVREERRIISKQYCVGVLLVTTKKVFLLILACCAVEPNKTRGANRGAPWSNPTNGG